MLKNNWIAFLLIGLCLHVISCTREVLNEKELYVYLKDESNGLIHHIKETPFNISMMYKPNDLIVLQEIGNKRDSSYLNQVQEKYEGYIYFVLNYSSEGKEVINAFAQDRMKFKALVTTLSFEMYDYVSIVTDKKEVVPLADAIYSRSYGMSGGSKVILVFNKSKLLRTTKEKFKIKLKDIGLGIDVKRFEFDLSDLNECPTLKWR